MKSKISAMMDGELPDTGLAEPLRALREDCDALETWRQYHLIGDALRDTQVLSSGYSERFAQRLAQEPTVLAPARLPMRPEHKPYKIPLALAAGVAAVATVGLAAFVLMTEDPQIPQAPAQVVVAPAESTVVAVPKGANDYLLAHQNYSPRGSLQGVAPYVRTVSESARPR